jgi:hypothetical protein
MKLHLENSTLNIELNTSEKVLSLPGSLAIPWTHITEVKAAEPASNWWDIRAPGTFLPGVIKAGTYYTRRGKEFWYYPKGKKPLVLELRDENYKRIILGLDDAASWQKKIQEQVKKEGHAE